MKTLKDINSDIKDLRKVLENIDPETDKRLFNKAKKQLAFARLVKQYLQTEPREDFIKSEIRRLQSFIAKFDERTEKWLRKEKGEQAKELGIPQMKKQISTMHYILGR